MYLALIDNDLFLESNKNADLLFYLNLHNKYQRSVFGG